MQNLEKYRKEIFGDETSAGDEGVIAESIDLVNDRFKITQAQMIEALMFLYSIKDSFLGKTEKTPPLQIWEDLSAKIIKHLDLKNIVKQVCDEFGISQAELARRLDVPASTVGTWASGKIPKMAEVALSLMIENKRQKEILDAIKTARDFIGRI